METEKYKSPLPRVRRGEKKEAQLILILLLDVKTQEGYPIFACQVTSVSALEVIKLVSNLLILLSFLGGSVAALSSFMTRFAYCCRAPVRFESV